MSINQEPPLEAFSSRVKREFLMTIVPFSASLEAELAQREKWHNSTRIQRCGGARAIIQQASPLTVLKDVWVLYPYKSFEGHTRYRKVMECREVAL